MSHLLEQPPPRRRPVARAGRACQIRRHRPRTRRLPRRPRREGPECPSPRRPRRSRNPPFERPRAPLSCRRMSDAPWSGRLLHFIGIGGAGMSGLALVALGLGARVSGSDRADSPYADRLREAGIEPLIGHDPANLPDGAEVVVSTAIAEDNPELAAARAAGLSDPPSRRAARRGVAPQALPRGGGHARQDHHRKHGGARARELRAAARLPDRRRGALHRHQRILGAGRLGCGRGRRVRPLVPAARAGRCGGDERRARPPLDLPDAAGGAGGVRRFRRPGANRDRSPPASNCAACRRRSPSASRRARFPARGLELLPSGSRFRVEDTAVELHVPGRHNVLNALAALAACREAGVDVSRGCAGADGLPWRRPPLRAAWQDGVRGARVRRLRPPSHRGPRNARGRPHPGARATRGRIPASPLFANQGAGARVRAGAGPRRPRRGARHLPGARGSRGLPGRERLARGGCRRERRGRPAGLLVPGDGRCRELPAPRAA